MNDNYIAELSAIKIELKKIIYRIEMIEQSIESDKRHKQSVYNFKQFAEAYMKNKEVQYAD